MDFVAIDFETANERRDSACAVGLAVVENHQVVRTVSRFIRPREMRFSKWNSKIHGITEQTVEGARTLDELWPEIWQQLKGKLLVAHNAAFDMSVLRHSLYFNNVEIPSLEYLCSLNVSRVVWPELVSHSLGFLSTLYSIGLDHHNAESDARAAAELLLKAGTESGNSCPFALARHLGISVGQVYPDGNWVPSSGPRYSSSAETLEIEIPDGFDLTSHPLFEKNVAFTGTLQLFSRSQAFRIVESLGGFPTKSVTKRTDILVTGIQDICRLASGYSESAKLRKAKELKEKGMPIQIISDNEFQTLIFQLAGDVQSLQSKCEDTI